MARAVVIANPIINSPFDEPRRHFRFDDDGITPTTARLLAYWTNPDREKRLFFCQIEALETAVYITEVAKKYGDAWIENELRTENEVSNPGLPRVAFKMATGSSKTVVMAMLIAWHALNKLANPQDARFSDTFLIVTPGITIRDRLRVLLPNDPQNYIFRNDDGRGGWLHRPNTILVDSQQLESGEAMSAYFKQIAAREIEEFKAEYRQRFPGRDAENLTDEDLLREVMNTVGKPGKLGEHVKCVVSVSMLTEGWDANTVTHILGVRAFGTQLLCEQVVGRALRRVSYAANDEGRFEPEYAEVYGVPFSFIPCSPAEKAPKPGPMPTRVRALEDRIACEITFPRLVGYRYDVEGEDLKYKFTADSQLALSTADLPTKTENSPIVGETSVHTLDDLKDRRPNEVAFLLAKLTLEKYFRSDEGDTRPWLNFLIEVTGEKKKDKAAKVATARNLWVPAVNNHGGFGHWAFVEVHDPWDAARTVRALLESFHATPAAV